MNKFKKLNDIEVQKLPENLLKFANDYLQNLDKKYDKTR